MTKFLVRVVLAMSLMAFVLGCDDDPKSQCETIQQCPDCTVELCASESGQCWFRAGGKKFGNFSCFDTDASMNASMEAMAHCGCS